MAARKIKPTGDRLLVKRKEEERMTSGGIVIPDTATEKPILGEVMAVGPGKFVEATGDTRALSIKVGDTVLFGKYAGSEVRLDGQELVVMREDDILAVVE